MSARTRLPDPVQEPTLTVARLAGFSTLSIRGIYLAVARGDIPSVRVGRRVVIPTAAALRVLGLTTEADQP